MFYFDKRRNAYSAPCKQCRLLAGKTANRNWRKENPEKDRASGHKSKLKSKYGLSLEALTVLWVQQNKACAICYRPISLNAVTKAAKPHIDHCHVSGVVRGLLCLTCNTGLGMFGDSLNLLDAARNYLLSRGATAISKPISDSASVSAALTIH